MHSPHVQTGVWMDFVNIGGGLGIPYRPEDAEVDVAAVAAVVAEVVSAKCEALGQVRALRVWPPVTPPVTSPCARCIAGRAHAAGARALHGERAVHDGPQRLAGHAVPCSEECLGDVRDGCSRRCPP